MATDQPCLTNWGISSLTSVRMKISLVSWIASTETDPKGGLSGQSFGLLFGQDLRPQAEQRVSLCLLQERLQEGHLTCHHLLLDQTNCDPML